MHLFYHQLENWWRAPEPESKLRFDFFLFFHVFICELPSFYFHTCLKPAPPPKFAHILVHILSSISIFVFAVLFTIHSFSNNCPIYSICRLVHEYELGLSEIFIVIILWEKFRLPKIVKSHDVKLQVHFSSQFGPDVLESHTTPGLWVLEGTLDNPKLIYLFIKFICPPILWKSSSGWPTIRL